MSNLHPQTYRKDIDGLRAIAVSLVLLFHIFPNVLSGGFVGVDVFFVISGFLISGIIIESLKEGNFSFAEFYSRRIRRIFPALVIVVFVTLVFGDLFYTSERLRALAAAVMASGGFVSNILFYNNSGYFGTSASTKALLHLWSLGVEEQFYLVAPFYFWFCAKRKVNWLTGVGFLGLISFLFNIYLTTHDQDAAFYLPHARIWELLIGCAIAGCQKKMAFILDRARDFISFAGLLMILGSSYFLTEYDNFPGYWALLPTVGTALIIWAGSQAFLNRNILSLRPIVYVGLISYPLYLWHWPIYTFALDYYTNLTTPIQLGVVGVTLLLAMGTYEFLEKAIKSAYSNRARSVVTGLVSGNLALMLIGFYIFRQGGFPERFRLYGELGDFNLVHFRENTVNWLGNKCHMTDEGQRAGAHYDKICIEQGSPSKPSVVIWGDSHAAALAQVFRDQKESLNIAFSQFTGDGCPPLFSNQATECVDTNKRVLEQLIALSPKLIILNAKWTIPDLKGISDSIELIRGKLNSKIVVFGASPRWRSSLAENLMLNAEAINSNKIPKFFNRGLLSGPFSVDHSLKDILPSAEEGGPITFFSVLDTLCNPGGCLTQVDDNPKSLTTFDYGHLTVAGARHVLDQFRPVLSQLIK